MTEEVKPHVTFADTGEVRQVKRACNRCYGSQVSVAELEWYPIVSQYGTVHEGGADGGMTACGIDATGERWWWHG